MECPFSAVRYRTCHRMHSRHVPFPLVVSPTTCLSARRAASLPDSRAASLADYFHRPACFLYRLHTVRAAFSKRSSRRSRDVIPVRFGSRLPTAHAHVCRLRSPHRRIVSCGRAVFPPSIPPRRPDIAAARSSRRMAPRGAGRASLTCQFGADRHGS